MLNLTTGTSIHVLFHQPAGGGKAATNFMVSDWARMVQDYPGHSGYQLWVDNCLLWLLPLRRMSAERHHPACLMKLNWSEDHPLLFSDTPPTWLALGAFILIWHCFSARNVVALLPVLSVSLYVHLLSLTLCFSFNSFSLLALLLLPVFFTVSLSCNFVPAYWSICKPWCSHTISSQYVSAF